MLKVKNLNKTYIVGNERYDVLKNIEFNIEKGEFVAIMGSSGSGKTTLLNSIAHFIPYNSGEIFLNNKNLSTLNEDEFSEVRNKEIGFVFQDFMLLYGLTIFENICVPKIISEKNTSEKNINEMEKKAYDLLELFEIQDIGKKYPDSISGGQKQRTAIARALINEPILILADEPTGNLDSRSGQKVIDSFKSAKDTLGVTILMVTHDINAASYCDRVLLIKDGELYKDIYKEVDRKKFVDRLFVETNNLEDDDYDNK